MIGINFIVDYVTTLPFEGNNPKVHIVGNKMDNFIVQFIDNNTNTIIFEKICKTNQSVIGERQWFTNWLIKIYDSQNNLVYINKYKPKNKVIFIKIDAYGLGDTIAWFPYIEEFRKKYNCTIICSTFWNELFEQEYQDILFVKPNTRIGNVYSQFYIVDTDNIKYTILSRISKQYY
jgi:autotransporter strand-loop-strand O-heptosyltransferase